MTTWPKLIVRPLLAVAALAVILKGTLQADDAGRPQPFQWTKFPGNPVLPEGAQGEWDHFKSDPFVMKENGVFRMWHAANVDGAKTGIGYAESLDGVNWDQHPGLLLTVGPDGAWDDEDVETPTIVKQGRFYHLWYSGRGEPEGTNPLLKPDAAIRIGHAVSVDGVNWIKDPQNPVLEVGGLFQFDGLGAAEPSVIFEEGIFKLWYTGVTIRRNKLFLQIGYATSLDGRNWRKHPANPVLSSSEFNGILTPSVLRRGEVLGMWYTVFDEATGLPAGPIREAVSKDGVNWFNVPRDALTKGQFPEWDWWGIFGPTVLFDEGVYKMWYSGVSIDQLGVHLTIGHALGEF